MKAMYIFKGILVICVVGLSYVLADLALEYNVFDFKTDYEPNKEVTFECREWVRVK